MNNVVVVVRCEKCGIEFEIEVDDMIELMEASIDNKLPCDYCEEMIPLTEYRLDVS